MASYRKRPIVIEAVPFDPHAAVWPARVTPWPDEHGLQPRDMSWGYIDTHDGRMSVQVGDYIVTDADGDVYPCPASAFEARYERVEDH